MSTDSTAPERRSPADATSRSRRTLARLRAIDWRGARAYGCLWLIVLVVILLRHQPTATLIETPNPSPPEPFRISLNRDPWERLTLIEGIGPQLAQRIVAARRERGRFRSWREIMDLPGVPDRPFEEYREYLTLD